MIPFVISTCGLPEKKFNSSGNSIGPWFTAEASSIGVTSLDDRSGKKLFVSLSEHNTFE